MISTSKILSIKREDFHNNNAPCHLASRIGKLISPITILTPSYTAVITGTQI